MRARRSLRALAATCVLGAAGVGFTLPAGGEGDLEAQTAATTESGAALEAQAYLAQYGWWNKAQQVPGGSATPVKPPQAPEDGLYIAQEYQAAVNALPNNTGATAGGTIGGVAGGLPTSGTPAGSAPPPQEQVLGPTAFGAVRFVVPDGADSQLTLRVLNRATSTPAGADPAAGVVMACLAASPWDGLQNGRYDQAPSYDCVTASTGALSGDTLIFDLGPQFVLAGTLDVVLAPSGSTPFQMAIERPADSSIVIKNLDQLMTSEEFSEDFAFEDPLTEFMTDSAMTGVDDSGFVTDTSFDAGSFAGGTTRVVRRNGPVARPTATATPAAALGNPFDPNAGRADRILAVALLLGMGAALWWLGGQPVRAPRLLGSLGGPQAATTAAGAPAVPTSDAIVPKGIGRFARPRGPAARPPRLF